MSVVIIGGGGDARKAINEIESRSLTMTAPQRVNAEALLASFTAQLKTFTTSPQPA